MFFYMVFMINKLNHQNYKCTLHTYIWWWPRSILSYKVHHIPCIPKCLVFDFCKLHKIRVFPTYHYLITIISMMKEIECTTNITYIFYLMLSVTMVKKYYLIYRIGPTSSHLFNLIVVTLLIRNSILNVVSSLCRYNSYPVYYSRYGDCPNQKPYCRFFPKIAIVRSCTK